MFDTVNVRTREGMRRAIVVELPVEQLKNGGPDMTIVGPYMNCDPITAYLNDSDAEKLAMLERAHATKSAVVLRTVQDGYEVLSYLVEVTSISERFPADTATAVHFYVVKLLEDRVPARA